LNDSSVVPHLATTEDYYIYVVS